VGLAATAGVVGEPGGFPKAFLDRPTVVSVCYGASSGPQPLLLELNGAQGVLLARARLWLHLGCLRACCLTAGCSVWPSVQLVVLATWGTASNPATAFSRVLGDQLHFVSRPVFQRGPFSGTWVCALAHCAIVATSATSGYLWNFSFVALQR
jgi:hypothetical protein